VAPSICMHCLTAEHIGCIVGDIFVKRFVFLQFEVSRVCLSVWFRHSCGWLRHNHCNPSPWFLCRHVSFTQICDCHILPYFSHISAKSAYRIFFPHKLAFSTTILILFVFILPISIRFRYLSHLLANRMAPSMCLDPCGTRWGSWFQAVLYHISAYFCRIFGVYAVRIF